MEESDDWYERRYELARGDVVLTFAGERFRLNQRFFGDAMD